MTFDNARHFGRADNPADLVEVTLEVDGADQLRRAVFALG